MRFSTVLLTVVLFASFNVSIIAKGPRYTDPKKTDVDFEFQGEYSGSVGVDGDTHKVGVQLIALGKGKFKSVAYLGGLPGDGWYEDEKHITEGELVDGAVIVENGDARGIFSEGVLTIEIGGTEVGTAKKIERKSPTLSKKAPEGAVVLFDGSNTDHWEKGRLSDDGLLMQGTKSKKVFQDHHLHIEFRLPYQPEDRGQGRGNSGIYLQGRYEVQMLDSFGLEGKQNECGGVYSISKPRLNMCYPPLSWQTYDIDFTAAKYDSEGKVTSHPKMTVRHNGVVIHKDLELPHSTTASINKPGSDGGPVYLQDHSCPVRYRNIWVVEK